MANGGQINYNIKFNADTQSLQTVKKQLQEIQNMTTTQYQSLNPNASKNSHEAYKELVNIKQEAAKVEQAFQKAFNTNLGTVNLQSFKKELAGLNLNTLYKDFSKLGDAGVSAFNRLSTEILTTNVQMKKTHAWLNEMMVSFKNTVKWGISSSVFNSLTGSIQKAWAYTKNLDKSLNDIRIVSGQSADQMERFAIQANKASQSLGATTLDYTKASLIYFQQGLDELESMARADITVKMSNVLGASASEVSDYMTAIWNNFDNGTQSLEHYADVITALGAATASSSEEIATGLEKFSSVANTVGLSYEYATSALATVVAQTRQSADTVGTAFKTLFARIESLNLGETLDDGTTLGKYAQALEKVGINIKDQYGQLKDMDKILDEMGTKWQTLSRSQQVALAQNVAGTRQYAQLIALMDNWDDFNQNLEIASNSTGALQKQQDIYLDSVEAHLNKMTAASERLMDAIFDTKSTNGLTDGLTNVINLFANFVESIGGGRSLLLMLGSVGAQVFGTDIATGIATTIHNLRAANRETANFAAEMDFLGQIGDIPDTAKNHLLQVVSEMRKELAEVQPFMTEDQVAEAKKQIDEVVEAYEQGANEVNAYRRRIYDAVDIGFAGAVSTRNQLMEEQYGVSWDEATGAQQNDFITQVDNTKMVIDSAINDAETHLKDIIQLMKDADAQFKQINQDGVDDEELERARDLFWQIRDSLEEISVNNSGAFSQQQIAQIQKYIEAINSYNKKRLTVGQGKDRVLTDHLYGDRQGTFKDVLKTVDTANKKVNDFKNNVNKAYKELDKKENITNTFKDVEANTDELKKKFSDSLELFHQIKDAKVFTNAAAGIGQMASAAQTFVNVGHIWDREDLGIGEKFLQTVTALATGLSLLGNGWRLLTDSWRDSKEVFKKIAVNFLLQEAETKKLTASTTAETIATTVATKAKKKDVQANIEETASNAGLSTSNITVAQTFKGVAGAVWSAMAPLLPYVAAVGLLAGAIALVVWQSGQQERELAALEDAYKSLNEDLEDNKQKLTDIKNSFDQYDKAVATLDSLQKGSTSWYEALNKVNEEALNILKTYPQLAKVSNLFSRDQDGVLRINQDVVDDYINSMQNAINVQQFAVLSMGAQVSQKRADIAQGNLQNRLDHTLSRWESRHGEYATETHLTDEERKEISDKIQKNMDLVNNNVNQLANLTEDEYRSKLLTIGVNQDYIDSLMEYQDDVDTLANETEGAANQIKNAAALIAAIKFDGEESSGTKQSLYATKYQKEYKKEYNRWLEEIAYNPETGKGGEGISKASGGENQHAKNALEALNAAQGTNWVLDRNGVRGTDTNRFLAFRDEEGQEKVLSAAQVASIIAASKADKKIDPETVAEEAKAIIDAQAENLGGDTELADIVLDKARTDFKDLTYEQVEAIREAYNTIDETTGKSILGISNEDAEKLGYDSGQEYLDAIAKKILDYDLSDSAEYLADQAKSIIQKGAEDLDVDEDALTVYKESLQTINEHLKENEKLAAQTTVDTFKFAKGIDALNKAYEDNTDLLDKWAKSEKTAAELGTDTAKAVGKVKEALRETYGVEFDEETIHKNFDTIKKAMQGDMQALNDMELLSANQYLVDIGIDTTNLYSQVDGIQTVLEQLANADLEVGAEFNDQAALQDLDNFLRASQMTATQAQAYLNKLGYDGEVKMTDVPGNTTKAHTVSYIKDQDGKIIQQTESDSETTTTISVPTIKANDGTSFKPLQVIRDSKTNANQIKNSGGSKKAGGSKNKPDKMEHVTSDPDRYHKVNTQITKVDNALSKLQSQEEKALGSKWLDNLNNQWNLLNTQIDNYNEKLRIANEEQSELAEKIAGKGVEFNADGTIKNYAEAIKAQEDYVNGLIDQYNNMSKAQQEKFKDTVEQAKEDFEEFKTNLDRYDELISDFIPNLLQSIQDEFDKQIEINIQKFNKKIEIRLEMNEATRDWNEWYARIIEGIKEDDILGSAGVKLKNAFTYLDENSTGDIQATTQHLSEALDTFRKLQNGGNNIFGDDAAESFEQLKDNLEKVKTSLSELKDIEEALYQSILDEMNRVQEKFDEQIEAYEFVHGMIEHDMKVIQLVYGDDSYEELKEFYNAQQTNYEQQLEFQRQQKEFWKAEMDAAEEGSEQWEDAKEKWINATNEFNSLLETTLESARSKLENMLNATFKALNKSITNGLGLEYTREEWDLINKEADQYLDSINAAAGITGLENKYIDAINKSSRVKDQQRITAMMNEELDALKAKDKLSQYDLDRAEKKYNLLLAQIALEDAQANKTQMRLRRDSQGNYTYQYVADEEAINKAEDDLRNAYNDLYNFDKDAYKNNLDEIYSLWDEYQQKMLEASLINDPEARAQKQALIQEHYQQLMTNAAAQNEEIRTNLSESAFLSVSSMYDENLDKFVGMTEAQKEVIISELGGAFQELTGFYNEDIAAFRNLAEEQKHIIVSDMVPQWNSGVQAMADKFYGPDGFATVTSQALNEIREALDQYNTDLATIEEKGGQSFATLKTGYDADIQAAKDLVKENNEVIDTYGRELDAVKKLYNQFKELTAAREADLAAAKRIAEEAYEALYGSYQRQAEEILADNTEELNQNGGEPKQPTTTDDNNPVDDVGGEGGLQPETPTVSEPSTKAYAKLKNQPLYNWAGTRLLQSYEGREVYIGSRQQKNGDWAYLIYNTKGGSLIAKVRKDQFEGFRSGGYTGNWDGGNGRLAMLHQKELVLNASDTENMLNTVAIMRSLAYQLGTTALARMAGASAQGIPGASTVGDNLLTQDVHIQADFPNVQSAREIEDALNNLINAAAQRVHEN